MAETKSKSIQFDANTDAGTKLWRKVYKHFPEFKTGMTLFLISLAGTAYFTYQMMTSLSYAQYGSDEGGIIFYGAFTVAGACCAIFSLLYSRRGGKKDLKTKSRESVRLYPDHLTIDYLLNKKGDYHVEENLYYCDILEMEYQEDKGRLYLSSGATIKQVYHTRNGNERTEIKEPDRGDYYIYRWYPDFNRILSLLQKLSSQKIANYAKEEADD